jgi:hypothetical protein
VNRDESIQRKQEVSAEIARLRRQLAGLEGSQGGGRRSAELDRQIQALMAEEHRLRLQIDRTR